MAARKHKGPHKYRRRDLGSGFLVYYCTLPKCTHYIRRDMALHKTTLCWSCNREIEMGHKQLDQAKPHCLPKCKPQRVDELSTIENMLNQMLETARKG